MQRLSFNLLAFELGAGVVEIEEDATLMEFLDEELGTLAWRGF
jgi:hypothetical protein